MSKSSSYYKEQSIREFTHLPKSYETDCTGVYIICRKDDPDILEELKQEPFIDYDLNDQIYHEIIECITSALDAKDAYTAGHSKRVSEMSLTLSKALGLSAQDISHIHIAAHLHDIGKIGIPDAVLNKEGKLNEYEWDIIKSHPRIGAQILSKSKKLSGLIEIVLHHHERFDGKGYPDGLSGENIPLGARVIAICDSIDAMTSHRKYRNAASWDDCYREIEKNLGSMYDPVIGKVALENWKTIKEASMV